MDSYSEHLILMRKDAKAKGALVFLWVSIIAISVLSFFLIRRLPMPIILTGVAFYLGVRFSKMLNVEYEYIVTNGEMDVDMIQSKTNRKRLITFNCSDIEKIEPYVKGCDLYEKGNFDKKNIYCNSGDSDVYCVVFKHKTAGKVCLVMQLPEKMRENMLPFLNKLVAREAFK